MSQSPIKNATVEPQLDDIKQYRSTLKRLFKYLVPQSFFLFLSIIGFALYAATQPLSAVLIEWLIKTLDGDFPEGATLVPAAFIVVAVLRGVGTYMGSYYIAKVTERMIETIRRQLFDNIIQLPLKIFDQKQSGKLVSLFTYNSALVSSVTAKSITIVAQEGLTVIALIGYLFYANWQFTLTFLLIAPPIALIIGFVGKRIKLLSKGMQKSMARLNGEVSESFSSIRLVKGSSGEASSSSRFGHVAADTKKLALKISKVNSIYTPVMQILIACAMALVVVLVIRARGDMDTAALIAYVTAAALLSKPIRSLSNVHVRLSQASMAADEIFSYIDMSKERDQGTIEVERLAGGIEFKNVGFFYEPQKPGIIENLSFSIQPGKTVALVGRSGSGKSTIANLIPRFYDIQSGSILVDSKDIESYTLSTLRKNIAIVSQQVTLFNESIAANIAYGCEWASPQAIERAAQQANAHEFIEQLPEGYNTVTGENGVLLSGGQRQRLSIARAILRNAPILILDEATSALDNESEKKIQRAIDGMMGKCTTLVIAHRLSTIQRADKILVLDSGKIIESGTHEELSMKGGNYARMLENDFAD